MDPWQPHRILGQRLRNWRKRSYLNQAQVATLLHVSRVTVSHIEAGIRRLSFVEAIILHRKAGMPLEALLTDE
jgi:transcriptional regulator with XRE-family HTH domain